MFNLWLADDQLYGEWLLTWLSVVMALMVSHLVLSFFPRYVLDEIWDRIESVPENFSTYFYCQFQILHSIYLTDSNRFCGN